MRYRSTEVQEGLSVHNFADLLLKRYLQRGAEESHGPEAASEETTDEENAPTKDQAANTKGSGGSLEVGGRTKEKNTSANLKVKAAMARPATRREAGHRQQRDAKWSVQLEQQKDLAKQRELKSRLAQERLERAKEVDSVRRKLDLKIDEKRKLTLQLEQPR
jgi:hypothetical protein